MERLALILLITLLAGCTQAPRATLDYELIPLERVTVVEERVAAVEAGFSGEFAYAQYAQKLPPTRFQTVEVAPSSEDLSVPARFSIVAMEKGQPENVKMCEAIFATLNSHSVVQNYFPSQGKATLPIILPKLYWLTHLSSDEVAKYQGIIDPEKDCQDLAASEKFHFDRTRFIAEKVFNLFGSQGPWILSVDMQYNKSVLLDFYYANYRVEEYPAKVAQWKRYLAENSRFWMDSDPGVRAAPIFTTEYVSGALTIRSGTPPLDALESFR